MALGFTAFFIEKTNVYPQPNAANRYQSKGERV